MFLGCGLAAVAGGFIGSLFSISPTMGSFALMKGIAVIILGGLGSIPGAVVGGLILGRRRRPAGAHHDAYCRLGGLPSSS